MPLPSISGSKRPISARMRRIIALLAVFVLSGCSESLVIRSVPPGAQVILDGNPVGITPMVFETKEPKPMTYRIEAEGFPAAEGSVTTRLAPGRVVGAVFTLGIVALARPMFYFVPNPLDVHLGTVAAPPPPRAILKLYNVKNASVLAGECTQSSGGCWIELALGERCSGDFIRENQGTTTLSQSSGARSGYGVGFIPGTGVVSVGTHDRGSAIAGGTELPNMIRGIAVMRCERAIIDCTLTIDRTQMVGHGECTDTHKVHYRATLAPKGAPGF